MGAAHPHKSDGLRLLEQAVIDRQRLVTDVEALQEILHRYVAIDRRGAIQPAFDALLELIDEVFPIDRAVVEQAKSIVLGYRQLKARDAIHVATMQQHGVRRIMSFDASFDGVPGLTRIGG